MSLPPHQLRPAEDGDRALIIDSWLKSYRSSPWAKQLPDWVYWSRFGHVGLVEHLVATSRIIVACLPEDNAFIYGWAAVGRQLEGELLALHYVFTKQTFRKQGFAGLLLSQVERGNNLPVTHITPAWSMGLGRGRQVRLLNPYKEIRL